jgi:hypothetical protein
MVVKTKFDPRKLMELAIEVMRQSVPEPRADGKASPKEFLAQALERAAAAKKEPVDIVLSQLENKLPAAVLADFSKEALAIYRERAGIAEPVDSDEFTRRLLQQGLLKANRDTLHDKMSRFWSLFSSGIRIAPSVSLRCPGAAFPVQ